ncbi:DsbA family protein [Streptococcus cuniculipharyngis]|uniref:Thioredoxin n=1 Tax=Streptococcus cuniculipharyngis TaxID=1562651 RepID=A0A5C5SAH5_9STRE|nr:DsbA family protein [Streptococcus cuniculipharyngis]TWS97698.1 thioredoxin [Streptococcus cuniculipharyngis]
MKLYYIWDAYCGWSYGFNSSFTDFHANHPELDLEIISGGLFLGENSKAVGDYGFFEIGNAKIAQLYPVTFGENYQKMLEDGNMVLDSTGPAVAFAILREQIPKARQSELAFAIQKAYFIEGKSLSRPESYQSILSEFGLDKHLLNQLALALETGQAAQKDFQKASAMGVQTYPTVIAQIDDKYYDFRGRAVTATDLENNYQSLLEREK